MKKKQPKKLGALDQERVCVVCGKLFLPRSPSQVVCSVACARDRHAAIEAQRRAIIRGGKPEKPGWMETHKQRWVKPLPPGGGTRHVGRFDRSPRVCEVCGSKFVPTTPTQTACSKACTTQRTWAKRHGVDVKDAGRLRAFIAWDNSRVCSRAAPGSKVDEYGFRTTFAPSDRCPLVDDGKITEDELLNFRPDGGPSILDVCALPKKERQRFTGGWLVSEYQLARRYMARKEGGR